MKKGLMIVPFILVVGIVLLAYGQWYGFEMKNIVKGTGIGAAVSVGFAWLGANVFELFDRIKGLHEDGMEKMPDLEFRVLVSSIGRASSPEGMENVIALGRMHERSYLDVVVKNISKVDVVSIAFNRRKLPVGVLAPGEEGRFCLGVGKDKVGVKVDVVSHQNIVYHAKYKVLRKEERIERIKGFRR